MAADPADLKRLIESVEARRPAEDRLGRLSAATELASELAAAGDELVDHFVSEARAGGCSWAQIGSVLGISKQAAQQRFTHWTLRLPRFARRRGRGGFFQRFTERARQVVTNAQHEARGFKHNYIGTEHLLLALLVSEGVAGDALRSLGVTVDAVRSEIRSIVGEGNQSPAGHIPFTPRSKKVLELSLREAIRLGHNYIGTEHLLLGIIREGEGLAMQILTDLKIPVDQIEPKIKTILTGVEGFSRKPPGES
jgi:Clp amino terminal domain, pathogenicity island component